MITGNIRFAVRAAPIVVHFEKLVVAVCSEVDRVPMLDCAVVAFLARRPAALVCPGLSVACTPRFTADVGRLPCDLLCCTISDPSFLLLASGVARCERTACVRLHVLLRDVEAKFRNGIANFLLALADVECAL